MCLQLFVQISNLAIQQQRTRWELHWRKVANSLVIFWRRLRNGWDGVWKSYDPCLHMWNYVCTNGHVHQCCCSLKDIQTNSWYLWAKIETRVFSSHAIVSCFVQITSRNCIQAAHCSSFRSPSYWVDWEGWIIYYNLSCYRVGYMFPKSEVLKWPSVA